MRPRLLPSMHIAMHIRKKQHPPMKKLFLTWKDVRSQLASELL
jgi:hypothetical protein